jgi:predicted metallo-beta-lactamase superfamily hydrolase
MFSLDRYKFVSYKDKKGVSVIAAISSYAGKHVKGYAKANPNDEYSEEKGKKLAIARCAEKIARKRKARAARLLKKAQTQMAMAQKYVDDMTSYYNDACVEVDETKADLDKIYAKM